MSGRTVPDVRGKRALVYSLGMEGRDLASWLLANGASVTISDTRTPAALAAASAVAPEGVERVVSGQPLLDPAGFDLVATSQSVLRHDPAIARARELGIPVISQMQLFLELCPARVVGITGSSGKSTTTALVGQMARAANVEHVLGGNIGVALLNEAASIRPSALAILEISHTQLQYTRRAPDIAAITNVTPNHLDQFSWEEYVGLKRQILEGQAADSAAVINADDEVSAAFAVAGERFEAAASGAAVVRGATCAAGAVRLYDRGSETHVLDRKDLRLRGDHNLANVVMACAVALAMGLPSSAMREAALSFTGVPHRLEVVGRANGVTWVNDSIATSPERTMAGLRAFSEPVVLLLGGREKHLPLEELCDLAHDRCRAVICFGEAADLFADTVGRRVGLYRRVQTLEQAVAEAADLALPGDAVLLSPAGTSFDAYPSFEVRGAEFRALVRALPGFTPEVTR